MTRHVPQRQLRFYLTAMAPCPYLPGKTERKVFTELKGPHAEQLNDAAEKLVKIGAKVTQHAKYVTFQLGAC